MSRATESIALTAGVPLKRLGLSRAQAQALAPLLFSLLVFWSAWQGLALRWADSSGTMLGLIALGAGLFFWLCAATKAPQDKIAPDTLLVCLASLGALIYAVSYAHLPGLLSKEIALMTTALILLAFLPRRLRRQSWALLPLLMLAPPLEPSLNFFLGYPLRRIVAVFASFLLPGNIMLDGVGLSDGVTTVFVDAPCSGVRMLGSAALLGGIAAAVLRLRMVYVGLALALAGVLAIIANVLRAMALFLLMRDGEVSDALHSGVGLVSFGGAACFIVVGCLCLDYLSRRKVLKSLPTEQGRKRSRLLTFLAISGLCAALAPLGLGASAGPNPQENNAIAWPVVWEGEQLLSIEDPSAASSFWKSFPGAMHAVEMRDSKRRILFRYCEGATRKLHPAEECYRATGWTCEPAPAYRDDTGHIWSTFKATHPDGHAVNVRQCYFVLDEHEQISTLGVNTSAATSYSDTSAWYWAVARPGSKANLTLAVTISEAMGG